MTSATSPRFSSMTMRMPDLSDSSRSSLMPSILPSRTSSAIFSSRRALFTWYGSSGTMIGWRVLGFLSPPVSGAAPRARPGGAVDQQVRQPGRHHQWLVFAAVVVRSEVDRVLVEVGEHFV